MPHLVEGKLVMDKDTGKMMVAEQRILEKDIVTQEQYGELLISALYGSYDNFAKSVRQYMLNHPEELIRLRDNMEGLN